MVLYFSGTGNSQFVAVQIAEMTADDEVVTINQSIKTGSSVAHHSERRWSLSFRLIAGGFPGSWSSGSWKRFLRAAVTLTLC